MRLHRVGDVGFSPRGESLLPGADSPRGDASAGCQWATQGPLFLPERLSSLCWGPSRASRHSGRAGEGPRISDARCGGRHDHRHCHRSAHVQFQWPRNRGTLSNWTGHQAFSRCVCWANRKRCDSVWVQWHQDGASTHQRPISSGKFFFQFSDPNQLISSSKFYQLFYGKMDTKRSCDICMNVRWVRSFEWSMDPLIDWLIDWSIDLLAGWCVDCLIDELLLGWLDDWLIDWLIDYIFLWNLQDRILTSQCPPRLRVLTLHPNHWSRVPSQALRVHELKMSDVRGWSMLCDDPVSILAVHIPEEDRCIDILELIENEDLLQYVTFFLSRVAFTIWTLFQTFLEQIFEFSSRFHAHTLTLYCSISSHSNYRVAHALVKHVDQKQLLFALQNPCKLFCMLQSTLYSISFLFLLRIHQNPLGTTWSRKKKIWEKKNLRKKKFEKKIWKKNLKKKIPKIFFFQNLVRVLFFLFKPRKKVSNFE